MTGTFSVKTLLEDKSIIVELGEFQHFLLRTVTRDKPGRILVDLSPG
jgi:hypothetical protein